jgi:hypothetical protein
MDLLELIAYCIVIHYLWKNYKTQLDVMKQAGRLEKTIEQEIKTYEGMREDLREYQTSLDMISKRTKKNE